jgi:hypothetical protein
MAEIKPTVWDKVKKTAKSILTDNKLPERKPAPSTVGSGYASNAASAAKSRNQQTEQAAKQLDSYKKGGKVKKTGPANLHKNERVLTTKQTKKLEKSPRMKKKILGKEPTVSDYRAKR